MVHTGRATLQALFPSLAVDSALKRSLRYGTTCLKIAAIAGRSSVRVTTDRHDDGLSRVRRRAFRSSPGPSSGRRSGAAQSVDSQPHMAVGEEGIHLAV